MTVLSCKTNVEYEPVVGALIKQESDFGRAGGHHDNALKAIQGTWSHWRAIAGVTAGLREAVP